MEGYTLYINRDGYGLMFEVFMLYNSRQYRQYSTLHSTKEAAWNLKRRVQRVL